MQKRVMGKSVPSATFRIWKEISSLMLQEIISEKIIIKISKIRYR